MVLFLLAIVRIVVRDSQYCHKGLSKSMLGFSKLWKGIVKIAIRNEIH